MKIKIQNDFCNRELDLPQINQADYNSKGMIDSHGHIMWLGMTQLGLNLESCKSAKEVIEKAKNFSENSEDNWILGRGWNNESWDDKSEFSLEEIDKIFPERPLLLKRIDGHAAIANSESLKLANINNDTLNPDGGVIQKINGKVNGLLIDNAIELVEKIIPEYNNKQLQKFIIEGINNLANLGIMHTCDMDVHLEWLDAFKNLAQNDKIKIKVDQYYRGFDNAWKERDLKPEKINNLHIKGLKFFADGAIGSRGAKLFEDYSDEKGNSGLFLIDSSTLYKEAKEGCKAGFEIATHAIGDAANRMVLDVYEKLRQDGFNNNLRIEHAQMVHPDDLARFKKLNVEAHIQPIHCISDEKMAERRLGKRVDYSYPWKSLIDLDVKVYGGSDYPIESHDPLIGIKSLVNPKIKWQESETLAINEALKIYRSY